MNSETSSRCARRAIAILAPMVWVLAELGGKTPDGRLDTCHLRFVHEYFTNDMPRLGHAHRDARAVANSISEAWT